MSPWTGNGTIRNARQAAGIKKRQAGSGRRAYQSWPFCRSDRGRDSTETEKRHQEGADREHRLSVNGDRIFTVLPCAVREHVHELQPLQGEETDGGEDDIDSGKHEGPASDHENKRDTRIGVHRMLLSPPVSQHDDSLEKPSDPCQFDLAAQYQEDTAARPQQDPVEFTVSNHQVEGIEAAEKCLRQVYAISVMEKHKITSG